MAEGVRWFHGEASKNIKKSNKLKITTCVEPTTASRHDQHQVKLLEKTTIGLREGSKCSATINEAPTAITMSIICEIRAKSIPKQQQHPAIAIDIDWLIYNKTKYSYSIKAIDAKLVDLIKFFLNYDLLVSPLLTQKIVIMGKEHRLKEGLKSLFLKHQSELLGTN